MYCNKCGKEVSDGTRFCPHCGAEQNGQAIDGGYAPSATMKCVSFGTAVKNLFKNYGNFRGRATRGEYWWVVLFNLIMSFVLGLIPIIGGVLGVIYSLALFIAGLSLFVRRLHDVGKSWPYMLFLLIPLVGGILVLVWLCTASDGDNRWGSDPRRQMEGSMPASRPQAVPVSAVASRPQTAPAPTPVAPPVVRGTSTAPVEPTVKPPVQGMVGTVTAPQVTITYICDGAQRRVDIRNFPCVIGRDSSAAKLVLTDPKVSRVHAQIYQMEQTFYLEDMQSANGTVLNGAKIQEATELHSGDVIVVGITRLTFEIE